MLYPDVPLKIWCKTHNLKVKEFECRNCGIKQETTIPFISQECIGLMAPLHECGPQYQAGTMVARDPKERAAWSKIFNNLLNK